MTEKIVSITTALNNLEHQYVEHKEKFEKWKTDNVKQRGTETYNKYVEQFTQWELGVKEQQRLLLDERNNLIGSSDVDVALDGLLSRISLKEFMLAIVTMTSKDPSFFPFLLSAFRKPPANGDVRSAAAYHAAYQQSAVHAYVPATYAAATPVLTAAPHPYSVTAPEVAAAAPLKRPFDGAAAVDEPPRKSYRAPSPIKDYRNPSTLPFRDFSQS